MSDASQSSQSAVNAQPRFIVPQDEKPVFESAAFTDTVPKVYFDTELVTVPIRDMLSRSTELSLDREGFALLTSPTAVDDLYDDEAVETTYRQELIDLLIRTTSANRTVVFDATRRSDSDAGAANPDGQRGPADRVHVDHTVNSGPQRARDALSAEEVDKVLAAGGRIKQINVWRPINGPVQRTPLAFAGASSNAPDERVETDQVFPDRVGEIYQIAHKQTQ